MLPTIKGELLTRLVANDNKRDRSVQVSVGPSEIGGCGARLWHRVNKTEPTNPDTLRLAAIMGTAIHTIIEFSFADDPRFITEEEVTFDGITGHIDLIDTETQTIWDWKTTTKSGLGFFPSKQQIDQVQIYGYLASKNGFPVKNVGLVAIARDGNELDIREYVVTYDAVQAADAINRYQEIRESFDVPAPEKEATFCANYCPYFGACPGITVPDPDAVIANAETIELIEQYKDLQESAKEIGKRLEFAKEALEGTQGKTPSGVVVKWSQVAGRQTIDEQAVLDALGFVPKKQGAGYARLTVK